MDPTNTLFQKAFEHHQAKNHIAAEAGYRDVLSAAPDHPSALHLLGVIESQKGNYPEALGLVERSLALTQNQRQWMMNYGKILFEAGLPEKAQAAYEDVLRLFPDHEPAAVALTQLKQGISLSGNPVGGGFLTDWAPPCPLKKENIDFFYIENMPLGGIKVAEVIEVDGETYVHFIPVEESAPYKYLNGDVASFTAYNNFLRGNPNFKSHITRRSELDELVHSIRNNGYPFQKQYICIHRNENVIRDGRNRAAVLRYLWGDRIVPIVRFFMKRGHCKPWGGNGKEPAMVPYKD